MDQLWWKDKRTGRRALWLRKKKLSPCSFILTRIREQGDGVRSRLLIWDKNWVTSDTSTSVFSSCIIQESNVLAAGWLTGQTTQDLSSCFIYVVRCSEMRQRCEMKQDERCGTPLERNRKWRCHLKKLLFSASQLVASLEPATLY